MNTQVGEITFNGNWVRYGNYQTAYDKGRGLYHVETRDYKAVHTAVTLEEAVKWMVKQK